MDKALIIFTKIPTKKFSKTRLSKVLDDKSSLDIQISLLNDLENTLKKLNKINIYIYYIGNENSDIRILKNIFRSRKLIQQKGKDIWERMYNAFDEVLKIHKKVVLIGSDILDLSYADIEKSFNSLKFNDAVLGASLDRGYYLLGLKKLDKLIFKNIHHKEEVFKNTYNILKKLNYKVKLLPIKSDLDEKSDMLRYRKRVLPSLESNLNIKRSINDSLKISIIIPLYNEEKSILSLQKQLNKIKDKVEIIFVDGGSTDKTLDLLDEKFLILHSQKGRAIQMNTGAINSSGDILFFLHCDSDLPKNFLEQIKNVMNEHRAGCFGIAFKTLDPLMNICRFISNMRVFDRKVMFGDQGIFIERDLFFELGGYKEIPIMEDYQLSLDLKRRKIKLGMCQKRIYTSYRRFKGSYYHKLKLMWKMNRLRKMYRDGVDINYIAGLYKDIR